MTAVAKAIAWQARDEQPNLFCDEIADALFFFAMSTVSEIREAIRRLPPKDAWKLAEELRDHLDALWDKQFEEDVKTGRLDALIARARAEHASGNTRSMDEILRDE